MKSTLFMTAALMAALTLPTAGGAQDPGPPPPGHEEGHGPGRGFGPGGPHGPGLGRMAEQLGLSDEQKAQLEALRTKQHETLRPLTESARQAREAFRIALDAPNPDATAVGQAALAMKAAESKVRAAHDAAFEEVKAILTPEQREKLEQARARGPRRGPRPPRP